MNLRSPSVAMLWELWRVTRAEMAWKLALPIGGALATLALGAAFGPSGNSSEFPVNDGIAALALILIVIPHLVGWLSTVKLNGGQPGFPLYLAYARPVRTVASSWRQASTDLVIRSSASPSSSSVNSLIACPLPPPCLGSGRGPRVSAGG